MKHHHPIEAPLPPPVKDAVVTLYPHSCPHLGLPRRNAVEAGASSIGYRLSPIFYSGAPVFLPSRGSAPAGFKAIQGHSSPKKILAHGTPACGPLRRANPVTYAPLYLRKSAASADVPIVS